jgi:hypothetical protein
VCVYVPIDVDTAVARDAARPAADRVGAGVVARMGGALEPPGQRLGAGDDNGHGGDPAWDARHTVIVPPGPPDTAAAAVAAAVVAAAAPGTAWVPPVPDPPRDAAAAAAARAAVAASVVHQADLSLRGLVTAAVTTGVMDGKRAAAARKRALGAATAAARSGAAPSPDDGEVFAAWVRGLFDAGAATDDNQ